MSEQLNIPAAHDPGQSRERILIGLKEFPRLADKIYRSLLLALHSRGVVTIDSLQQAARTKASLKVEKEKSLSNDQNVPIAHRWDEIEKRYIEKSILKHASQAFTPHEVDDMVLLTRKREEAQTLEEIANLTSISFRVLADKVRQFCALPRGHTRLDRGDAMGVRVALVRQLISDQLEFIGVAKNYLAIRDFEYIVERMIGEQKSIGQIGGKAAGMFLAHRILEQARAKDPAAPDMPIEMPESYYLRTDVIRDFLEHNGLVEMQSHKYRSIDEIRNDYPAILEVFKNAEFPKGIVSQLRALLKKIGKHPLIVRSSSMLEDRFGTAFAGKYRSVFLANQGPLNQRLRNMLGAIAEVYASMMHPDPISYRKRHNLLDYDDHMGVLIQKVVGNRYGDYFFPTWAGVSFSRNEYRWSRRLRREDGLARIVMGLGTRAVDRVSKEYPRMVALSHPSLRPTASVDEVRRYSQKLLDLIDLKENRFATMKLSDLLSHEPLKGLELTVSILQDNALTPPIGKIIDAPVENLVITFDRFAQSPYPELLKWVLKILERAYGAPVDVEFSFDGEKFYILQCRPQAWRQEDLTVRVPTGILPERGVFSASKDITSGRLHGVEYIVLIDPRDYERIDTEEKRSQVSTVVRQLNDKLQGKPFILMGPGRWGSNDPRLGIKVSYSDISNTRMLVEIARSKGEYVPEVSFGTHFFQDLVEANILYLSLYPDLQGNLFNEKFLHQSHNSLAEILPAAEKLSEVVKVIDVRRQSDGLLLNVDLDGDRDEALGYLAKAKND